MEQEYELPELIGMLPTPKIPEFKIPSIPFPPIPSIPGLPNLFGSMFEFMMEKIPDKIRFFYKLEYETIKVDDVVDEEKGSENDVVKYFASLGFIKKYLLLNLALKMVKYQPQQRPSFLSVLKELDRIQSGDVFKLTEEEFTKRKILFPYQEEILREKRKVAKCEA